MDKQPRGFSLIHSVKNVVVQSVIPPSSRPRDTETATAFIRRKRQHNSPDSSEEIDLSQNDDSRAARQRDPTFHPNGNNHFNGSSSNGRNSSNSTNGKKAKQRPSRPLAEVNEEDEEEVNI